MTTPPSPDDVPAFGRHTRRIALAMLTAAYGNDVRAAWDLLLDEAAEYTDPRDRAEFLGIVALNATLHHSGTLQVSAKHGVDVGAALDRWGAREAEVEP